MSSPHAVTPGYDDGWFNGNPKLMIPNGSYDQYRDKLKGFSSAQLAEFDKQNEAFKAQCKKDGVSTDIVEQKNKNYAKAMKAKAAARVPDAKIRAAKLQEQENAKKETELAKREAAVAEAEGSDDTEDPEAVDPSKSK